MLQQLIAFNLEGNFDAVMGFMGCVIGVNETYNQYEAKLNSYGASYDSYAKEINKILVNNTRIFRGGALPNEIETKKYNYG